MKKICPRCGKSFECRHGEIEKCQCAGVNLDPVSLEYIKKTYTDCICIDCLRDIKEKITKNGGVIS